MDEYFFDVIKKIKELNGLQHDDQVARLLKIKKSNFSDYKKRQVLPIKQVIRYCKANKISLDWLINGTMEDPLWKISDTIIATVQIPVLARCPAGFPEGIHEGIIEYLALPDVPPNTYAIIVVGDSMSPAIKDGEYALFVQATEIRDGDVVIAKNEWSECMVKRYHLKDGRQLLTSDNPEYPTIEPNEHYKIIGKVIEVITRRQRF